MLMMRLLQVVFSLLALLMIMVGFSTFEFNYVYFGIIFIVMVWLIRVVRFVFKD